jgi:hypothetical protein
MAADIAAEGISVDRAHEPFNEPTAPGPCDAQALTFRTRSLGHELPLIEPNLRPSKRDVSRGNSSKKKATTGEKPDSGDARPTGEDALRRCQFNAEGPACPGAHHGWLPLSNFRCASLYPSWYKTHACGSSLGMRENAPLRGKMPAGPPVHACYNLPSSPPSSGVPRWPRPHISRVFLIVSPQRRP